MPLRVRTGAGEVHLEGRHGDRLLDLLDVAGFVLNTRCGGAGSCRGCLVQLGAGAYRVGGERWDIPDGGWRPALACRTETLGGDAVIAIPAASLVEQEAQIVDDFSSSLGRLDPTVAAFPLPPPAGEQEAEDASARLRRALPTGAADTPLPALRELAACAAADDGAAEIVAGRCGDGWYAIAVRAEAGGPMLGAAVDIGTTTVVAALVNLRDGAILARASMYNQQITKADDVAARISFCRTAEDVGALRDLVVRKTINVLLRQLARRAGCVPGDIVRMTVGGNTVMGHLFLGLHPGPMGRIPFAPAARRHPPYAAEAVGLDMHPQGLVDVLPAVSAYVGGDLVADLYVSGLAARRETTLLVDIGTNGEILLKDGDGIFACATAAGPAFEGAGLACGCRAARGAIEHVSLGADLHPLLRVIGNTAPMGLCGSAILDFVAEARRAGALNEVGRYDLDALRRAGGHLEVAARRGSAHAWRLADGPAGAGPVYVSEADLEQVLKAKAAIYAGMRTLLATRGKTFADLGRLILAGGFARHVDLAHAMEIGLLPRLPPERVEIIGNGSLAGAFHALVDSAALPAMEALAAQPKVVELNLIPEFESHFVEALLLP